MKYQSSVDKFGLKILISCYLRPILMTLRERFLVMFIKPLWIKGVGRLVYPYTDEKNPPGTMLSVLLRVI
ncbi:MAG: hypothetical protein Ct9H300mP19_19840 [Dehalococcoidia bacterium]|nr:MAG: hypothetical protein Ct9H300mP19_19840 [Dehalococcoidia bacterium]